VGGSCYFVQGEKEPPSAISGEPPYLWERKERISLAYSYEGREIIFLLVGRGGGRTLLHGKEEGGYPEKKTSPSHGGGGGAEEKMLAISPEEGGGGGFHFFLRVGLFI